MWSGNFKAALANLRSSKGRSFLTMLGVILGVSSVVTVVSLGQGLKNQVVGQVKSLGSDVITIRSGNFSSNDNLSFLSFLNASTLTDNDVAAISHLPSVSETSPVEFVNNLVSGDNGRSSAFVLGAAPELQDILRLQINYGLFFSDETAGQNVAVIGPQLAQKIYSTPNPVGHSLLISGQHFVIGGVLSPSSGGLLSVAETDFNSSVFIPTAAAKNLTGGQVNILQILARASDSRNIDGTVADINRTLLSTHQGQANFAVLKQYELANAINGVLDSATRIIAGIAAVSLLVGAIGIADIMLVSVSERTREIGIRKAIGATNRQILQQFLVEGIVLSVMGGLGGIVLALLVDVVLRLYTSWHPAISILLFVLAAGVSVLVGIVSAVVPAVKAARKDPFIALRGQ